LSGEFAYRPGQFLTVRVPHNESGSVARCYSLSSSPHTGDRHTITVKRVADGHASNWLADNMTAGSMLDTLPPAGTFTPRSLDTDFLMFAGGSGITPVMSIVKSVLARGQGQIVLIYANRDEPSVIFSRELGGWRPQAVASLLVLHWLDSLQGRPRGRDGGAGPPHAAYEAFLCGPDPYLAVTRQALGQLGVPSQRIHAERFVSLAENPFEAAPAPAGGVAATPR
jgi:3-ketosteroid 9alpha-monooxygenase subunit B